MIQNDNITKEYGTFTELRSGTSPISYKPKPVADDYTRGYITRWFAKKLNENSVVEIQSEQSSTVNRALYAVVNLRWQITGPRYSAYAGNIVDKVGVEQQNQYSIQTVQAEDGVDLSKVLANLLEYWQGR